MGIPADIAALQAAVISLNVQTNALRQQLAEQAASAAEALAVAEALGREVDALGAAILSWSQNETSQTYVQGLL